MTSLLILLGSVFFAPPSTPFDSLRTEAIDGKLFVIHQVDQGETLYSLSRRYGCSIEDILQYNKDADAGLDIGEILRIPYVAHAAVAHVEAGGTSHTVNPGETLFSISRQYNVTVDELKQWNNLNDNAISVGQVLVIHQPVMTTNTTPFNGLATVHTVMQGETLYSISKQFNVSVSDLMEWNHLSSNAISVGQTLYLRQPDYQRSNDTSTSPSLTIVTSRDTAASRLPIRTDTVRTYPIVHDIKISEAVKGSQEVVESGLAELIEGTEGNRKYLALHRSVPVGTILKIRNEMNNREVFVRVIGKLPDTAQNNGLLIKISRSAYDRLGAIDPRFRVEITYYK